MQIPKALSSYWSGEPEWVARLPAFAQECADQWSLDLEKPFDTPRSLVLPAGDVVLKLNAPGHHEAAEEGTALRAWDGNGAVGLVAEDRERRALLVERCRPGTPPPRAPDNRIAVILGLVPRLLVAVAPEENLFPTISTLAQRSAEELQVMDRQGGGHPVEPSALALAVDLLQSVESNARTLVNQDLHPGNILRAEREPWLVIDPKPAIGEPEVTTVGLLRSAAWDGGTPLIRRWLDALQTLGLDREWMRGWGVAHALAWGWNPQGQWSHRSLSAAHAISDA